MIYCPVFTTFVASFPSDFLPVCATFPSGFSSANTTKGMVRGKKSRTFSPVFQAHSGHPYSTARRYANHKPAVQVSQTGHLRGVNRPFTGRKAAIYGAKTGGFWGASRTVWQTKRYDGGLWAHEMQGKAMRLYAKSHAALCEKPYDTL